MAQRSAPQSDNPVVAVIDSETMAEVERLAEKYGVDPDEVLAELIRMDLETRPPDATLH